MRPQVDRIFPQGLNDGYRRFRDGRLQHERARYKELAETGQKPQVMLISCCDSRAGPEIIFDAAPGELFVLRNVAALVPPYTPDGAHHGTSAAVEFAVQALRVSHLVVMGHGRCGGISAYLAEDAKPLSPGDFIGKWITLLGPAEKYEDTVCPGHLPRQGRLERAAIVHSIENLRSFPCVIELEKRGQLALHGAWFDIETGELEVLDPESGRFTRP